MCTNYEYGIRHRHTKQMHRWGLNHLMAEQFMTEDWGQINPDAIFEVVRRPIGEWEPISSDLRVREAGDRVRKIDNDITQRLEDR